MKNTRGQNIVEYILMVVAVILVFLVVLNSKSGPVKKSIETTLNSTADQIGNVATDIKFK